jgi:hypothetical protein
VISRALLGEIAKTRQSAIGRSSEAALKATRKNSKLHHDVTGKAVLKASASPIFSPGITLFLDRTPQTCPKD